MRRWTIPAERMKREIEHVVPLSDEAIALYNSLPAGSPDDLLFPALEAVRLAAFGGPRTYPELAEGVQSMAQNADASRSAWLRKKSTEAPRQGTDTIIVTHAPNLTGAFAAEATGMAAGEALIFHPDDNGGSALVARIKIEEWPKLAGAH